LTDFLACFGFRNSFVAFEAFNIDFRNSQQAMAGFGVFHFTFFATFEAFAAFVSFAVSQFSRYLIFPYFGIATLPFKREKYSARCSSILSFPLDFGAVIQILATLEALQIREIAHLFNAFTF